VMDKCCMCKRNEESVDHLLLHCNVAFAIWNAFFSHFELCVCLDVLLICMTVDGPLAGLGAQRYGKWCLRASFGVCGGK
jgi:hypothetical protein